jgi:hypothetical protein
MNSFAEEKAVVRASLEGLSENNPDAITAMGNLIPSCRSEGQ